MSLRFSWLLATLLLPASSLLAQEVLRVEGQVTSTQGEPLPYATIAIQGMKRGAVADEAGKYQLQLPAGSYTLIVSAMGYQKSQQALSLQGDSIHHRTFRLQPRHRELQAVEVIGRGLGRLRQSAFNAVSLETRVHRFSTKSLSDVLASAPGVKVRQQGGVGSETNISLDGFSGRHVKVFIDGIPQEGAGRAFGLSNIPVSHAERIEVYRGVVPVEFASDAIGGVINVVTGKHRRPWWVDASYATGSFATHRSTLHLGRQWASGWGLELEAFQNYSKNNYFINTPVEDFATGSIDESKPERVRRFHDTYHNEAVIGRLSLRDRPWTDRLTLGVKYARFDKEIQTGVRQAIVFGERRRYGSSFSPQLEYSLRQLLDGRLDLRLMGSYTRSYSTLVDTTSYKYNWRGERELRNSRGEQNYSHTRTQEDSWTGSLSSVLRLSPSYQLQLSHHLTTFERTGSSLLARRTTTSPIPDRTTKAITGLALQLDPLPQGTATVFAKHYLQQVSGSIATTGLQDQFVRERHRSSDLGYGMAVTGRLGGGWQLKGSYEKAYRLPSTEELFGDTDLEQGRIALRPEHSHNVNLGVSWGRRWGHAHRLLVEGGVVWRDTRDYIQRNVIATGGGLYGAAYVNYGKVHTKGFNLSLRYDLHSILSLGTNYTYLDVRDAMPTVQGSTLANIGYRLRMPNLPYSFGSAEVMLRQRGLLGKGSLLSLTYDAQYTHAFTFFSEGLGSNARDFLVPDQLAHNLLLTASFARDRYALSLECRNLTDARLYDNFSLQKAGRAFYAKLRVHFGH